MYLSIHNVKSFKVLETVELKEHEVSVRTIQIVRKLRTSNDDDDGFDTITISMFGDSPDNLELKS